MGHGETIPLGPANDLTAIPGAVALATDHLEWITGDSFLFEPEELSVYIRDFP